MLQYTPRGKFPIVNFTLLKFQILNIFGTSSGFSSFGFSGSVTASDDGINSASNSWLKTKTLSIKVNILSYSQLEISEIHNLMNNLSPTCN